MSDVTIGGLANLTDDNGGPSGPGTARPPSGAGPAFRGVMELVFGRDVVLEGSLHPAFEPVARTFRSIVARYPGGAAVSVFHRGTCVVDLWGGVRDAAGTPWTYDTMAPSFSTTKGVAATLLHILVDRGLLRYEDRVAYHWPEFAQNGKDAITVRQVLAHQSGLYHIRTMIDHASRLVDWDHMIDAIERAAPCHPPGTRTGYHGLTFGFLVGELCQRVTGRPFAELVRTEIAEPLGLDGLYIGMPREVQSRAAHLIWTPDGILARRSPVASAMVRRALADARPQWIERLCRAVGISLDVRSILEALAPRGIASFDFGAPETLAASIPAANGVFTARSLARMYALLAGGGVLDGVRLLSPATLAAATTLQVRPPELVVIPFDMQWRLGWHGVFTTRGSVPTAFGHFGFGGSGAWADPSRELAVGFIVNSAMGTPFGDLRILRIGGAAVAAADRRS